MKLDTARLYVITPDAPPERVIEIATAAVRGGADIIQLRHKTLPRGEVLDARGQPGPPGLSQSGWLSLSMQGSGEARGQPPLPVATS